MSILGSYRWSGISDSSGVSDRVFNAVTLKPSGINMGGILGVGLYIHSGSNWIPLEREWIIE